MRILLPSSPANNGQLGSNILLSSDKILNISLYTTLTLYKYFVNL